MATATKTSSAHTGAKPKLRSRAFKKLQEIGKSLLFPISMLPIAAILLRMGAAIPHTTQFSTFIADAMSVVGNGVFGPALPFLFAIGIAFGMSKDNRGEAAIVGFASMVILTIIMSSGGTFGGADFTDKIYHNMNIGDFKGTGFHGLFDAPGHSAYNSLLANNVFVGVAAGGIVAFIYNKYNGVELPSLLGFFSGRRLVPVLSFMAILVFGIVFAIVFPWFGAALFYLGRGMNDATGNYWGKAGVMGAFGIINRLLIPFGLHHAINVPLWMSSLGGSHPAVGGGTANGDIFVFLNGVAAGNHSGAFQTGFFPIMMFGLPAIAAAIWFNAKGDNQKAKVASLFAGSALVSFFTGITEPIEFSFMFLAPALYGLHVILTGIVSFVVGLFGIQLGFGFSAGLIDYVLSIPKSMEIISANKTGFEAAMANPAWIWAIGAGTAALYFFGANFMIKKMNLNTPGRGNNLLSDDTEEELTEAQSKTGTTARAQKYVKALGGYANITMYSHCATRLRYDVKDMDKVDEKALQAAGAFGSNKVSKTHVQVIVGPTVEILNNEILAGKPKSSKAKVKTEVVPS